MNAPLSLEQRLAILEKEMADIKLIIPKVDNRNWFEKIAGSFKDEPDFDEILALGQAIRQADQFEDPLPPRP